MVGGGLTQGDKGDLTVGDGLTQGVKGGLAVCGGLMGIAGRFWGLCVDF